MNNILTSYIDYLKYELNYSENTIETYIGHLKEYALFLKNDNINFYSVNKDDVIKYLKYLDTKKINNKSISNSLSALRNFYDFLLDNKKVKINPFKLVHNPKIDKKLPNFLSITDMDDIFTSIKCDSLLDYRNLLIVELLYDTGMRVSELVNLKVNDFNRGERSIRVLGKGKKERIVYYTEKCENALANYLNIRNNDNEYLILNFKGNKISTRGIEKIIDNIILKASVNTKASPHTIRHTFATHLLNGGADIKSVQELLGHSSLNTTEIYTHITSDYLKEEYLKNMPRK